MAGEVEFLPDGQGHEPDDDGRVPGRRWRYTTAAAVVAVAALAGWMVTRPGDAPPRPAASPASSAAATPSRRPLTVLECTSGAPVATEIAQPMRRFLPGIRIRNLGAYRCVRRSAGSARIVSETVSGRYRGMVIGVETDLRGGAPGRPVPGLLDDGAGHGAVIARVETIAAGLHVAVTAYGTARDEPPDARLRDLADFISLNVVL